MFTDMVGFTALAQSDESQAMKLLEKHNQLLRPFFPKFHGREVKAIGDSFLVEFESALEATKCAVEIQSFLHEYNASSGEVEKLTLRIGIHLGDVIHSGDDVFGDAVNVASRIEPLADPEGVCISEQVHDQVRNKLANALVKLEQRTLKNVRFPTDVYKVLLPWEMVSAGEGLVPPCPSCGNPYQKDEFSGLIYCVDCDSLLARLPSGRSYMILAGPGAGKSAFVYKLIEIYLRNSKPCILLAFDEVPGKVRASVQTFVGNSREREDSGMLKLVDCFSCQGGMDSRERYRMHSAGDLGELEKLISKLIGGSLAGPLVLIDSATTIFAHAKAESVVRSLYAINAKIKSADGRLFFTLGTGVVPGEVQNKLETLADGLVELRVDESGSRTKRYYRFSKVRGTLYFDQWFPFSVGKEAIRIGPPEGQEAYARFLKVLELVRSEPS